MKIPSDVSLNAQSLKQQDVSVTRKMAASLPKLREVAASKGLPVHHLGAGYPHPEVTDPRDFLTHQASYFEYLGATEGLNDAAALPEYLRESFAYTDTLGPASVRSAFAQVYGRDWALALQPERLIPTVGATGGISMLCSLFERPGVPLAYITDAPTYAGFLARSSLSANASIFSVELDEQGPNPTQFRNQILAARAAGLFVPFYYTVPDGHNPAGISFSLQRRKDILAIAQELGVLIVEDAPYLYISYAPERPTAFLALDAKQTVHLFTGSKIGFPGPRIGFVYSDARLELADGKQALLTDLLLTEASSEILFQNPAALMGFEALLHKPVADGQFELRDSLWEVAETKLPLYRENRKILLDGLERRLGQHKDRFHWTIPQAGFFSVFTFLNPAENAGVVTDDAFIERLVADFGVVVIPMYDFYPADARQRNPKAGLNQLRLSFCFTESTGAQRRSDLSAAVDAFCSAVLELLPAPSK